MAERRLVVNLDHVATERQTRSGVEPDPVTAATLAVLAGADGVAVHLREDRRHVQDRDLRVLRQTIHGRLCLEMAATQEMLKLALDVRPDSVTLVPERPEELASSGGLDVQSRIGEIGEIARALHESGIRTGLCIDPDLEQVKAAHRVGARAVELHAGRYGERGPDHDEVLRRIEDAVRLAAKLKLEIGVGHGIDYGNVGKLAENDLIDEFSIGHAIVSRAIYVGMERAVREMKQLVGHA